MTVCIRAWGAKSAKAGEELTVDYTTYLDDTPEDIDRRGKK